MKHEIVMPQMGESIPNGTIVKWHKKVGDMIAQEEILLEISTDKVESEIPSMCSGRVEALYFSEDAVVDVGVKIALIEDDISVDFADSSDSTESTNIAKVEDTEEEEEEKEEKVLSEVPLNKFYTPLVRTMAKSKGIDLKELESLNGSGISGRVNKSDFLTFLSKRNNAETSHQSNSSRESVAKTIRMSSDQVIPMDNMRKVIAKNMISSKLTAPHVNSIDEVDMTSIVALRESIKQSFKDQNGFSLTYTHFILFALVKALKAFPYINASIDNDNIILKKDINLGFAVSVPGNGLVVPVLKNADSLNLTGIARFVHELANKARNKKLTLDEMSGGTFTFSNVGSFGTLLATPIILRPQVAIMAGGAIVKRVMVMKEDQIGIRSMMYLTHTYDHRLVDGELGGNFLAYVKEVLETFDFASIL